MKSLTFLAALTIAAASAAADDINNPVQNPKMGHGALHWELADDADDRGFEVRADRDVAYSRPRSLRVTAGGEGVGTVAQFVRELTPGRPYVAEFWVRNENAPPDTVLFAGDTEVPLREGGPGWYHYRIEFTPDAADVPIGVRLPAAEGATIWLDDVSIDLTLEEMEVEATPPEPTPAVVTPSHPAEVDGVRIALEDGALRLKSAESVTVELDPTATASRSVGREERVDRREAAEAPEVRNSPRPERRDLYFPESYGPIGDDAFTLDLEQKTPTDISPRDLPLNDDDIAVMTLTVGDGEPRLVLVSRLSGPVTALVPSAEIYDVGDRMTATLVQYLPEGDDAASAAFWLGVHMIGFAELPAVLPGEVRHTVLHVPAHLFNVEQLELRAHLAGDAATATARRVDYRAEILAEADRMEARADTLAADAEAAGVRDHHLIRLGLSLADRFVTRVRTGGRDGNQPIYWSRLQLAEVDTVLDRTADTLDFLHNGGELPGTVMRQTNGPLRVEGSAVTVEATPYAEPAAEPRRVTAFPMGYGHFMQVHFDLPNFPDYGASIIQQGNGPGLYRPDGTLPDGLGGVRDALADATAARMKIDYLVGNGIPKWVEEANADDASLFVANVAFIPFNLDHPLVREWTSRYIAEALPDIAESPAFATVCLVNEPAYVGSGRDPHSRPAWVEYLREAHGDVAALNELYGTDHDDFESIDPPPAFAPDGEVRENLEANRAWYDWIMFNREHFGAWHGWMHDRVKEAVPDAPTHAKVMADAVFSRRLAYKGTDPEIICGHTDLAGVDAWHFERNSMADPYSVSEYAYQWQWPLIGYDLFHSFRGQPVFDSEKHVIRDFGRRPTRPGHLYTAHWQGALHNCRLSTMWVWEEPAGGGLVGNISQRPADIHDAGRAMFDLSRLADEVAALADVEAEVALLYSTTALTWQPGYDVAVKRGWTAAANLGAPATFVTDRQLRGGTAADVKVILLPRASYLHDETVAALADFVENGGTLVALGEDALRYDEYGRERELPASLTELRTVGIDGDDPFADERRVTEDLRPMLDAAGVEMLELERIDDGDLAVGIDRRAATVDGRRLIALTNMLAGPQVVRLPGGGRGVDLISGDTIDLGRIELRSLTPVLIEVE